MGLTATSEVLVHDTGVDAVLIEARDGVPVLILRPDMSFGAAVAAVVGVAPHLPPDDASRLVRRALPNAVSLDELLAHSTSGCSCAPAPEAAAVAALAMPAVVAPALPTWARVWRMALVPVVSALLIAGAFEVRENSHRDAVAAELSAIHEHMETILARTPAPNAAAPSSPPRARAERAARADAPRLTKKERAQLKRLRARAEAEAAFAP